MLVAFDYRTVQDGRAHFPQKDFDSEAGAVFGVEVEFELFVVIEDGEFGFEFFFYTFEETNL